MWDEGNGNRFPQRLWVASPRSVCTRRLHVASPRGVSSRRAAHTCDVENKHGGMTTWIGAGHAPHITPRLELPGSSEQLYPRSAGNGGEDALRRTQRARALMCGRRASPICAADLTKSCRYPYRSLVKRFHIQQHSCPRKFWDVHQFVLSGTVLCFQVVVVACKGQALNSEFALTTG